MASSKRASGQGAGVLIAFLVSALLLAGLGGWQFYRLATAFDHHDVTRKQDSFAFADWMVSLNWVSEQEQLDENAKLIALRLRLLTLPQRRNAVLWMVEPQSWAKLKLGFVQNANARLATLKAVELALRAMPNESSLWFVLAKLGSDSGGFDAKALAAFKMSYTLGPRETDLMLGRVYFGSLVWNQLDEVAKGFVRRDLSIVETVFPRQADEIRQELRQRGIVIGSVDDLSRHSDKAAA